MSKKILSLLLAGSMLLCSAAMAEGVSGTYSGEGTGYGGTIAVDVTLADSVITDITVTSSNETAGIGTVAIDKLIPEIIESQSVAVDTVSGATRASEGLLTAVTAALESSGVDMTSFRKAPEKAESTETVVQNRDIVIVGAGVAGMTAGIYAAEGGADVLVLEKMSTVGGAGAISSGATNSYGSEFAKAKGIEDSAEQLKEDMTTAGHGYNQEDLVDLFIENAGETFDWLVDLGVEYSDPTPSEEHSVNRVFLATGSGVSITNAIEKRCEEAGVEIMLETKATELITEDGKVVGVKAEGSNGTTYEIYADSVVLATGGYGANSDLLTDSLAATPYYGAACSTGDGHLMAQAVGAELVHMDFGKVYPGGWEYEDGKAKISLGYTLLAVQQEGAIIVNSEGVRTFREGGLNYEFKNAIKSDKNNVNYLVLDAAAFDVWKTAVNSKQRGNLGSEEDIENAIAANGTSKPVIYHADTLEEVAELAGMDGETLKSTVERWNTFVENGVDEDFGRTTLSRKIGDGPYYLIAEKTRFATTLGGVVINTNFEVHTASGDVIPGLYAIGEITYGVNGDDTIQGTPLTWAISSGRLVGQQLTAK
jgi:urocanate reductase